jgi:hypothetical protein
MRPHRFIPHAVVIALALSSASLAGNRQHRNAVRANRPYAPAVAPYAANVGYRGTATTGDVQTLTQAYSTLASADHDYQGHRVKAMHAIRKAARLMGSKIAGDGKAQGKGQEQQTLSDSQLRSVQGMLQQVRGSVSGRKQQLVVQHINEAIQHLSTALSIK